MPDLGDEPAVVFAVVSTWLTALCRARVMLVSIAAAQNIDTGLSLVTDVLVLGGRLLDLLGGAAALGPSAAAVGRLGQAELA